MYVRLAWSEEQDAIATFGEAYRQYAWSVARVLSAETEARRGSE